MSINYDHCSGYPLSGPEYEYMTLASFCNVRTREREREDTLPAMMYYIPDNKAKVLSRKSAISISSIISSLI
jgi:hypothetical protein